MVELVAAPSDSPQAAPLVAALLSELAGLYGANRTVPYDASTFAPPEGLFVVAFEGGLALGCGGYVRFDPATAELKRMYVAPEARGRGVGRLLLRHLESAAGAAGYSRMVLETGTRRARHWASIAPPATSRSRGFRPTPRRRRASAWRGASSRERHEGPADHRRRRRA